jgi:GWxTD domain-containing protein
MLSNPIVVRDLSQYCLNLQNKYTGTMKKYFIILIFLSFVSFSFGKPGSLRAYLSYAAFYIPEQGPYLETYLSILGQSVQFVRNENGKFQGTVMVTMLFKQNDTIREFKKYDLQTVEIDDTAHIDFIVFDQQRIKLPSGNYDYELELTDKNRDFLPFKAKDHISIVFEAKKIELSDIELIESFTKATETSQLAKSGYDFIPYQDYYYPQSNKKITFYAEIYNTASVLGSDAQFVIASSLQSIETGKPIDNYFRVKRETTNNVNVIFSEFDISQLPSGNFNLVISVRDKENKEIASKSTFFQRSNPGIKYNTNALQNLDIQNSFVARMNQADTLREFIRMCWPIAGANEKLFIKYNLNSSELITCQRFFYDFWTQRSAVNPEGAWIKYYETVLGVDQEFSSTNMKGYETDRGRVYLQYGSPNQRVIEPYTANNLPYEIWQYYKYGTQTDIKFVFYTPDRSLNDYKLLHSNAIGEVKNVNWQYELRGPRNPLDTDNLLYDKAFESDRFGEHSGELYNNPR